MNPEITQQSSIDPVIEFDDQSTPLTEEAKLCQCCKQVAWKYTCPRCLFHSCSSTCVKQHKKEESCSGLRDKTSYVALHKYKESNMMSDYIYLEDVSRQSDNITRSRLDTNKDLRVKSEENKAMMFSKSVNQLGIRFSSLPVGMSRHKLNQSNYNKNLKQIFWSIEINFCKDDKKERYLDHSFPSNKPFHAFFENLLFSESPQGKGRYGILRHQVKDFINAGMDQFRIALKKEKAQRGHFVQVSHGLDLLFNDILKGETIIEYPIFYVWLKSENIPKDILHLEEKKLLITAVRETAWVPTAEMTSVKQEDSVFSSQQDNEEEEDDEDDEEDESVIAAVEK